MPTIAIVAPSSFELAKEKTSTGVNAVLLADAFEALGWDVMRLDRRWASPSLVRADVSLVHDYHVWASRYVPEIKSKVKAYIMEVPLRDADVSFVFGHGRRHKVVPIGFPVWDGFARAKKASGIVLVDHPWPQKMGSDREWSERIYEALHVVRSNNGIRIHGLCDESTDKYLPSWVERQPFVPFLEYAEIVRQTRVFIVTHKGSYNGTVFDVLACGGRVIAPRTFIPEKFVPRVLGVELVDRPEGIPLRIMHESRARPVMRTRPMSEAVKEMDAHLKTMLEGR